MKISVIAVSFVGGVLGGYIGTCVLPVIAQNKPAVTVQKCVQAEKFELVDSSKRKRASLCYLNNETAFMLFDAKGNPRCALGVAADGTPEVALADENVEKHIQLMLTEMGPTVRLRSPSLKQESMVFSGDEVSGLTVKRDNNRVITLGTNKLPGQADLEFKDETGQTRLYLGANPQASWISFFDKVGQRRIHAGHAAKAPAMITILDETGGVRWAQTSQ